MHGVFLRKIDGGSRGEAQGIHGVRRPVTRRTDGGGVRTTHAMHTAPPGGELMLVVGRLVSEIAVSVADLGLI